MAYKDLRDFLKLLVSKELLKHIKAEADPVLEHASDIPAYGGKMGIDATKKLPSEGFTREWPDEIVMSEDIRKLVTERWKEYGFG
jgi:3-polyprenyl-4-hydroxybenzoate decarboxylase